MPLYVGDYLADTSHLNTTQHGAYLLLIMHYWRAGKLIADEKQLSSIARLPLERWRKISPIIQSFFEIRDGFWIHSRVEKELSAARSKYERRANSGRLGGLGKAKKFSGNARSPPEQCSTNHNHNHIKEVLTSSDAPSASRDVRADLFSTGLRLLAEITGKTPDSCRSTIGKWLKLVDDEAIHVLAAIEDAHRNRVADPVAWIFETLKPRGMNGVRSYGRKQHASERALEIADELDRALKCKVEPAGNGSGGEQDVISLLEWQRPA